MNRIFLIGILITIFGSNVCFGANGKNNWTLHVTINDKAGSKTGKNEKKFTHKIGDDAFKVPGLEKGFYCEVSKFDREALTYLVKEHAYPAYYRSINCAWGRREESQSLMNVASFEARAECHGSYKHTGLIIAKISSYKTKEGELIHDKIGMIKENSIIWDNHYFISLECPIF